MNEYQVNKTYQEINDKIAKGEAVVVTWSLPKKSSILLKKKVLWRRPEKWMWSQPAPLPPCVLQGPSSILDSPRHWSGPQRHGSTTCQPIPAWQPWTAISEQPRPVRMTLLTNPSRRVQLRRGPCPPGPGGGKASPCPGRKLWHRLLS